MNVTITPKTAFISLLTIIALLLIGNIAGIFLRIQFHNNIFFLLDFNSEKNIPTLYSAVAILSASTLLALIASAHKNKKEPYLPWMGLSLIFIFLAIDEFASIHERIDTPLRAALNTSGLLFYAWVIPYALGLLIFVAAYLKFLLRLPKEIMLLFITSGAIFVTGALGLELLEGIIHDNYGYGVLYQICYTIEEVMEMFGIALFIYALLSYMSEQFSNFSVNINSPVSNAKP